ncbi:MAG: lactonase family protein [Candidatus Hinthialibacter antarcticus]|nr:lactonase family protein [Candidatus Hinthialibacter antarcticus]
MKSLLFVGMYTSNDAKGVHVFGVDEDCTSFTQLAVGEAVNPSYLAVHPNKKFVYAVNEVGEFEGEKGGGLTAFSLDAKSGAMTALNHQPTRGGAPCYVSIDTTGQWAMVANYSGGNICSYPIEADGRLGEPVSAIQHEGSSVNPGRQKGPHAHCIYISPDNQFAYVCDLGIDKVMIYKIDQKTGALTANDPPFAKLKPGAGPRHIDFHPNGKAAFVINELDSTITVFHFDAKSGALHPLNSISTLPDDFNGNNSCADIHVSSDGKFVYGSNRGHNSIAVYSYNEAKSELTLIQHQSTMGKTPRNFVIDPSGRFLLAANQDSNSVVVFSIDQQSGKLKPTGATFEAHKPVCLKFMTLG